MAPRPAGGRASAGCSRAATMLAGYHLADCCRLCSATRRRGSPSFEDARALCRDTGSTGICLGASHWPGPFGAGSVCAVAPQTVGGAVRDRALARDGEDLIERAARALPRLLLIRRRFERELPLEGLRVSACLPVTPETANLMITLEAGGAGVVLCASDQRSTDDGVAAALASCHGVKTYAIRGEDEDHPHAHLASALAPRPP